jgi:hypothetical protein
MPLTNMLLLKKKKKEKELCLKKRKEKKKSCFTHSSYTRMDFMVLEGRTH